MIDVLRFSLYCVVTLLPIWSVFAQPPGESLTDRLSHPEIRSEFLSDYLIVDGQVDPRFWFGCCKSEKRCRLPEGDDRLSCHRFSDPVSANRLMSLTGARLGFRRFDSASMSVQRTPLVDALTDSNQLDDLIKHQRSRFLYVADLDLEALKQPSAIARWSKNIHLAGVRGIRLSSSAKMTVSEVDLTMIHRSLGMLFGRYFLMDVGGLTASSLRLVLDYAEPRKLPLILTNAHLGQPHQCAPRQSQQTLSAELLCRVVVAGGVLVFGAVSIQEGPSWTGCTAVKSRNDYLRAQLRLARQLSCQANGSQLSGVAHSAVSTNGPLLSTGNGTAGAVDAQWHTFAGTLLETNMSVEEVLDVLGGSLVRLLRRAIPGVQPPELLFPKDAQPLSGDRGIQFQWVPPVKNEPKRMPGRIFGLRGGRISIEKAIGRHYQPWRTERVISGDKKIIFLKPGRYRWRLSASNRRTAVLSTWGYFEVTPPGTSGNDATIN